MNYLKARKLSLEEVMPLIPDKIEPATMIFWCQSIKRGVFVSLGNAKMRLFKRQPECAACKAKADHFWIESNGKGGWGKNGQYNWHMNLYGINHHGHPVMLTLDHIKPRSKGGTRSDSNIQVLCRQCNNLKGNTKMSPVQVAQLRAQKDSELHKALVQAGILQGYQYQQKAS